MKTPDITPAQVVAALGSLLSVLVSFGVDLTQEQRDSLLDLTGIGVFTGFFVVPLFALMPHGSCRSRFERLVDPVRQIATAIGISIDQTKTCLLAVMYGARTSTWHENAIPETVGRDAAKRLNDLPLFTNIVADVKRAGAAILAHNKPNRQGGLVNVFGKSMPVQEKDGAKVKKKTWSKLLAHLIQGVEALALRTCVASHPGEIVLVQHDGFTAAKPLDVAALEQAIQTATGYALKLEEELVQPDLADQFGRAAAKEAKAEFSKVRKARKASNGAGSGRFHPIHSSVNSAGAC